MGEEQEQVRKDVCSIFPLKESILLEEESGLTIEFLQVSSQPNLLHTLISQSSDPTFYLLLQRRLNLSKGILPS